MSRRSRRPLCQSPTVIKRGSTHLETAFMGSHLLARCHGLRQVTDRTSSPANQFPRRPSVAGRQYPPSGRARLLRVRLDDGVDPHVAPLSIGIGAGSPGGGTRCIETIEVLVLGYGLPDLLRGTLLVGYYGARHYPRVNGIVAIFATGGGVGSGRSRTPIAWRCFARVQIATTPLPGSRSIFVTVTSTPKTVVWNGTAR